ncbi:cytochrome c oxidase assembly [Lynx pardinus]|uniref:Cytochrome c oxidase assembly protein COX19 n=1 Tax=Lynx pardinus TaxID=191816 RepID=A0A485NQA4_LYNPA|nr:cytochrome c oxidase assembly [Lynx pardinus]
MSASANRPWGSFPCRLQAQERNGRKEPGECKSFKEKFMKCLRDNRFENALCRSESKDYLECRMERQLMAQEPLEKLGFGDLMDGKPGAETTS